jgi:hypothetical protein
MTESEAKREMTFDEEYEILQAEKNELFSKENDNEEPPFANCVVRRALRCIRKLKEEREHYRAIGTVSEFRELKEKATAKKVTGISLTHEGRAGNCPNCKQFVLERYDIKCPKCKINLGWSE